MRRKFALGAILVALVALPASAGGCANLTLDNGTITSRTDVPNVYVSGSGGSYLLIQIGEWDGPEGWEGFAGETSELIPAGAVGASVCPDGSVAFDVPEVETLSAPVVAQSEDAPTVAVVVSYPATAHRLAAMIG